LLQIFHLAIRTQASGIVTNALANDYYHDYS